MHLLKRVWYQHDPNWFINQKYLVQFVSDIRPPCSLNTVGSNISYGSSNSPKWTKQKRNGMCVLAQEVALVRQYCAVRINNKRLTFQLLRLNYPKAIYQSRQVLHDSRNVVSFSQLLATGPSKTLNLPSFGLRLWFWQGMHTELRSWLCYSRVVCCRLTYSRKRFSFTFFVFQTLMLTQHFFHVDHTSEAPQIQGWKINIASK